MKTNLLKPFHVRIISVILVAFFVLGQPAFAASGKQDESNLKYIEGILELVRDQYWGDVSDSELVTGAVRGMLNSLDDYTTYYDNEEKDTFMDSITGVFGGIGISMDISGDYINVFEVFSGAPAEKAGLLQGDKIVEADGVSLIKATSDKAASIIKGEVGTKVRLGILRNGSDNIKYLDVTREIIKVNPVTYEIRNGIGYIKLEMFNENTDEYMTKALEEMDRKKITKLIFDLRNNPGGEVNQAVAVARKFVPKGLITKLDYQSSRYKDIEYFSNLEKPKYKLAVLVNGLSASASEIVSGAIQDTGAGKLIGTKTFGKAKFQSLIPILSIEAFNKFREQGIYAVNAYDLQNYGVFPLESDIVGYTKMTLGVYYTPKGRMIDGKGLTPDVVIEDPKPVSEIGINSIKKLTASVESGLNSQGVDVYNAKLLLKIMGYGIKALDNTLDADTAAALKAYQKKSGQKVSGILDKETQHALNAELLKLIAKYDMQYSAAVNYLQQ